MHFFSFYDILSIVGDRMKTGMYDNRLGFHELPFYEIEGLCEAIVDKATSLSSEYALKYEQYKKNITRFSPAFEFCMHELGWMLYDPFCEGNDEVLFSNGNRCFVASVNYVSKEGFDRKKIKHDDVGYPVLYDEVIKFDPETLSENIDKGIVDEQGFVSSTFTDDLQTLAEIMVMFVNMKDEDSYRSYMNSKDYYNTKLDYLTSRKNVIVATKLEDGSISLRYVSENDGKVQEFIDRLKNEGRLAELAPIISDENTNLMKIA